MAAMQPASAETVLGDFDNASATHFESTATFRQADGRYFVTTENSSGELQQFEVTHSFGKSPLQQYLVDGPRGRKQVLQYSWDSRPSEAGGQRWYHLYADEPIAADDPLHWTGPYFTWNVMCAECHSTNLQAGYDLPTDVFDTTYSEVSVGCEACHGPASRHVVQADRGEFDDTYGLLVELSDPDQAAWVMNTDTGIAERSAPLAAQQQVEACGRCHARRSVAASDHSYGEPLTSTHTVSLLEEGLYYPDGRILDEVYVYGSFLQSKMYAAGVQCSDCHNPHSGSLHTGANPNDICATCHQPERFATSAHSAEQIGDCVTCHMPATVYMGIDSRRDHSFRLPATDTDPEHYGAVIAGGRADNSDQRLLAGIANEAFPAIARATMLSLLGPLDSEASADIVRDQANAQDPLLRLGALRALRYQRPELQVQIGAQLLHDPMRSVRIEAAATLAEYRDILPVEDRRAYASAAEEYRAALKATAAMPEAALKLAEFERVNGLESPALYEHALRIGQHLAPVRHAFGLHTVRQGEMNAALPHFRAAVNLQPEVPEYVYTLGVALNSLGQPDEALTTLETARQRFPRNFDINWAAATMYRDRGDRGNRGSSDDYARARRIAETWLTGSADGLQQAATDVSGGNPEPSAEDRRFQALLSSLANR